MTVKVGDIITITNPHNTYGDYTKGSRARVVEIDDRGNVDVDWISHPEGFTPNNPEGACKFVLEQEYAEVAPTFSLL